MSIDLHVWEGRVPSSDDEAADLAEQLSAEQSGPPSTAIRAFLDALRSRWPDEGPDLETQSVWAVAPLTLEAQGSNVTLSLTGSGADRFGDDIVQIAKDHGLVVFDPQGSALL